MNKITKIIFSILGAIDTVFSIITPLLLSQMVILLLHLTNINQLIILIVGLISSIYRGARFFIPILK